SLDLRGDTDVRYDRAGHGLRVALTPVATPRARVTPIGEIPVSADGSWSGLIGSLGGLLGGGNVQDRARPMVETQGAQTMQAEMREGATLVVDLCSGQVDPLIGALDDGAAPPASPYPLDGRVWWENLSVILRPGAMDLAGMFTTHGEHVLVDLELSSGDAAEVALVCREEASRLASSFLAGAASEPSAAIARRTVRAGHALHLDAPSTCDEVALVVMPPAEAQSELRYRYRIGRAGASAESFVDCGP
ncbi:MAG: hypothetical protein K8H88_33815, partial [Sandaracinaceae bacterium]|nr:hypothetical protein [Sandaracinaceae bacterium]